MSAITSGRGGGFLHPILREANGIAALDRGEGVDFDRVMDEADAVIAQATAKHARKAG